MNCRLCYFTAVDCHQLQLLTGRQTDDAWAFYVDHVELGFGKLALVTELKIKATVAGNLLPIVRRQLCVLNRCDDFGWITLSVQIPERL